MQKECLIAVNEFCEIHKIEISFISSLQETGLIELVVINDDLYVDSEQLPQLEKIIHLYFELEINLEGIETIDHLLKQIKSLHDENIVLRNRLRLYESND
jgi:chaperone modulatory protein CbpM